MSESNYSVSLVVSSSPKSRLCLPYLFVRKIRLLYTFYLSYDHLNIFLYCSVINRSISPSLSLSTLISIQTCGHCFPSMSHAYLLPLFCHAVLLFGTLLYLIFEYFFPVAPSLHGPAQCSSTKHLWCCFFFF